MRVQPAQAQVGQDVKIHPKQLRDVEVVFRKVQKSQCWNARTTRGLLHLFAIEPMCTVIWLHAFNLEVYLSM